MSNSCWGQPHAVFSNHDPAKLGTYRNAFPCLCLHVLPEMRNFRPFSAKNDDLGAGVQGKGRERYQLSRKRHPSPWLDAYEENGQGRAPPGGMVSGGSPFPYGCTCAYSLGLYSLGLHSLGLDTSSHQVSRKFLTLRHTKCQENS